MNRRFAIRHVAGTVPAHARQRLHATQPFFFKEDGDLSHYMDVATDIEYPDVNDGADRRSRRRPGAADARQRRKLRDLGPHARRGHAHHAGEQPGHPPARRAHLRLRPEHRRDDAGDAHRAGADNAVTTFDPALVESGYGGNTGSPFSGTGVEAALVRVRRPARLEHRLAEQRPAAELRPRRRCPTSSPRSSGRTPAGTRSASPRRRPTARTFEVRNNINYDQNNNGSRTQPSDWIVNLEAAFTQPLLQGAGMQYNRIAGPRSVPGSHRRLRRPDRRRADQPHSLRHHADRLRNRRAQPDARRGRRLLGAVLRLPRSRRPQDRPRQRRWRRGGGSRRCERAGGVGGEANAEAQARSQYFLFRARSRRRLPTCSASRIACGT